MKFSEKTGCFYPEDVYYADLPDGLIDVSTAGFDAAMVRAPGDTLAVKDGALVIVPAPPMTQAQRLAIAASEALNRRDNLIAAASPRIVPLQDAFDTDSADASELARLTALKLYRRDLGRIDNLTYQPGFPQTIKWPVDPDGEGT